MKLFQFGLSIFLCTLIFIAITLASGIRIIFHLYPYLIILSSFFAFSSILLSAKRKKYLVATSKFISFFLLLGTFFTFCWPRDLLFSNIGIAPNIDYEEPIKLNETQIDSLLNYQTSQDVFKLSGSLGIYTAYISTEIKEPGIFYLKAFDAKGNIELSPNRISKQTETRIEEKGSHTIEFRFTQYDGVWESFFIGRIELWFKPTSKENGKKLLEKNFKIDGWVR